MTSYLEVRIELCRNVNLKLNWSKLRLKKGKKKEKFIDGDLEER